MEKIDWKKCENTFFINTRKSWPKNGGEKREKKIFPETHVYREQKTMEKNRLGKVRKQVFYKHTNIVTTKWGEKREKKIFLETQEYR